MFEVTKVDLKECNLKEALTLCAYLIINLYFYIDTIFNSILLPNIIKPHTIVIVAKKHFI